MTVKQIGAVTLIERYRYNNPSYKKEDEEYGKPTQGIFFNCHLACPDRAWPKNKIQLRHKEHCNQIDCLGCSGPTNEEMNEYARDIIITLTNIGILNEEACLLLLDPTVWKKDSIECWVKFEDLEEIQELFEQAARGHIVDIYLYQDGKVFDKYD